MIIRSLVLALCLMSSSVWAAMAPGTTPSTQGQLTNPAANALVADTGPQTANGANVQIVVTSTVAARFVIEWRNAANTANLWSQVIAVPANVTQQIELPVGIPFNTNERLRIIMFAAISGFAQGSIVVY